MKRLFFAAIIASALCADAQENYELRVLTFEDSDYKGTGNYVWANDWSTLIDDPQYGGLLLYGDQGYGATDAEYAYRWSDENNTMLAHQMPESYGMWCYWGGGHAISNYGTANFSDYGNSTYQLTVYNANAGKEITRTGNGHNGSDNFAMHFGYLDDSGFGLATTLPEIYFSDKTARVIDHMYVTNSAYALNCYLEGNGLTAKVGPNDKVKIVATGYKGGAKTGTIEFFLVDGPEKIVKDWTKFELASLGEVDRVDFNMVSTVDNGYGNSLPAYFAYDDVAVRFPKNNDTTVGVESVVTEEGEAVYYDLQGHRVANPGNGIYIRNGKKVLIRR